jgi:hypothetical protein
MTPQVVKAVTLPNEPAPDALRLVEKDGKQYIKRVVYAPTLTADGKTITGVQRKNGKPVIDESKSGALIPIDQFKNEMAKDLYSGKILQNEIGQDVDISSIAGDPSAPSKPAMQNRPSKEMDDKAEAILKKYGL